MSKENEIVDEAGYRDALSTVDSSGKRVWLYPTQPKGWYYDKRKIVSYLLLAFLIAMPFIKFNGKPFMLFNITKGEFIIFGIYFAPQDFYLFVIAMIIGIVFITLFTAVFGRLFCGWICPQTIFMEMVFRRIEYWIEGDANKQRRLNKSPWTTDKTIKKVAKHAIFLIISAFIAHIFLSYIIGVDEVYNIVTSSISEHWKGFIAMIFFTLTFYGVFAFMREQVCTTVCPYGRLQSVLLDENSLVVAYDFVRGEPRGKIKKKKKSAEPAFPLEVLPQGDCIDCGLCVRVCPTGIDIRNGTQLECVNCTACIDACDEIMDKVKKPRGLIRVDSYNGVKSGNRKIWNTRVIAYSVVLVALVGLESFLLMSRSSVETLFLRTPGMMYQTTDDGYISNLYNYQLVNKTSDSDTLTFVCDEVEGIKIEVVGTAAHTVANGVSEGAVFIKIPKDQIKDRKTKLNIKVLKGEEVIDVAKTTFFGPIK